MAVTEDALLDIIAKEAIIDRNLLKRDALITDVGIASLDVISIIFEIEEKFGIAIETDEIPVTGTVGDVVDLLLARINAPQAGPEEANKTNV